MDQITIMKPGCHVSMSGDTFCFTAHELAHVAATYDPALHQAPLVLGHPQDASAPAYGWVSRLITGPNGALVAFVENVSDTLKGMVREGQYRHLSASFWPPGHPASPRPNGYSLRHVGVLGASVPAVKGLSKLAFADGCDITSCRCAPYDLAADGGPPELLRYERVWGIMRATGLDWFRASSQLD